MNKMQEVTYVLKEQWVCEYCNKVFHTKEQFNDHFNWAWVFEDNDE